MDIVVVGSGKVGQALGRGWQKAGHKVTFAMRDPAKPEAADITGAGCGVSALEGAAAAGEVIALAVPWTALPGTLDALGPLDGKIVIDATNPLTSDLALALGFDDSAGETVAALAGSARVVKAFNTTGAGNMANSQYAGGKLMMPIAGDDAGAKDTVARLAADLGFDPVDVGPLTMSRCLEPLAMVWIRLAFAQQAGPDFGFAMLRR
jgi:hypothetical protein